MSHSKKTKRGYSLFVENWNGRAKGFINTCRICGFQGYSPSMEDDEFLSVPENRAIYSELKRTLPRLELDELGRCEQCAKVHDGE